MTLGEYSRGQGRLILGEKMERCRAERCVSDSVTRNARIDEIYGFLWQSCSLKRFRLQNFSEPRGISEQLPGVEGRLDARLIYRGEPLKFLTHNE